MKYIVYQKLEENIGEIISIRSNNVNIIGDYIEMEDNKIPEIPKQKIGIYYRGYINLDTKEITFKEFNRPLTKEEKQQEINAKLLKDNATLQIQLSNQQELNAKILLKLAQLGGDMNV